MATDLDGTNYSESDAANSNASPNGMPEGMAPSGVNDAWRTGIGATKRAFDRDHAGAWCTVGGTANAITLGYTTPPTALIQGQKHAFKATAANSGATTIAVGSLGAKNLFARGASGVAACAGGEIEAGDIVEIEYDGTQYQLLTAQANLATIAAATALVTPLSTAAGAPAHGECRLAKSGSNLVLQPYNGNKLFINGALQTVPSAGVSLAPTSLTVSALYYIYAFMSAGVMTLEASTTTHATDATTGIEIKSGDVTRTLVGMARPITGPAFADTAAQRFVLSYFNRRTIAGNGSGQSPTTASTSNIELSTLLRAEFLTWNDEAVFASANGFSSNPTATAANISVLWFDGTQPAGIALTNMWSAVSSAVCPVALSGFSPLAEGYHYVTIGGSVSTSTGSWSVQTNFAVRG